MAARKDGTGGRAEATEVVSLLQALLARRPRQAAIDLKRALAQRYDLSVDLGEINFILATRPALFRHTDALPPLWSLVGPNPPPRQMVAGPTPGTAPAVKPVASVFETQRLWDWQRRALADWEGWGYRGVVEAVTGTGKTRVGIAAAAWAAERGVKTLVIVPTTDLQRQWYKAFRERLGRARIGCFGGRGRAHKGVAYRQEIERRAQQRRARRLHARTGGAGAAAMSVPRRGRRGRRDRDCSPCTWPTTIAWRCRQAAG